MKVSNVVAAAMLMYAAGAGAQNALIIDAASKGHAINPGMYGIFFEEINHSGDGGLYAELLENRGFEEQQLPGGFHENGTNKIQTDRFVRYMDLVSNQLNWDWNYAQKMMTGWKVDFNNCQVSYDVQTPATPLHANTPNAMHFVVTASQENAVARLVNTGYWGIAVEKDAKYDLRFYLNTSDYTGKVRCLVLDADGNEVIAEENFDVDKSGTWKEYKGVMTASKTLNDAIFALEFSSNGIIDIDYVSLFPQTTFNNRPNGMRPDIAQKLVDLKPKFLRWPGGCIVEGIVLENRVKWKETLGDPMMRPGQYDLWGYRSTWGMGYHEILQFCEDTGMDCMFVGNCGLSCIGWGGEYVSGDAVEPYYQDIKDAIEYAIGDPASNEWAAKRAEAGHPAPFPLKYVEIGNENFGERYNANFDYIYKKLKAEYPQLTFLNTQGLDHAAQYNLQLGKDMIDPHWYVAPEFFYNSRTLFDNIPRGNYDIYVGEYATNVNVGEGNMEAALSEATFMMSMERNSDIVKMASYAPLITNDHAPNWHCNLIWQHSGEVFGRASYYTQKLFSENLPSYNLNYMLQSERVGVGYNGRAGIGTWLTSANFRNLKVSDHNGKTIYASDYAGKRSEWTDMQGTWTVNADGEMNQASTSLSRCITLMNTLAFRDGVFEVEACKTGGSEGFLLVFGCNDNDWNHYYQLNIGGWGNTGVAFEDVNNGTGTVISERPSFRIDNNRWYKIKVVLKNGKMEGYIDDKLYCTADLGTEPVGRIAAHAGYDEAAGEVVVKVVNAEAEALPLSLQLNAKDIASTASVETLKSESLWDENSYSMPEMISPVKTTATGVSENFKYTFEPYSLTIVRIKANPADKEMDMPEVEFSCNPRELVSVAEETGDAATLKAMLAECRHIMLDDVAGYDDLRKAAETAQAELNTADAEKIKAAIEPLRLAMNTFYKAQMVEANEMTDKIVNAKFEKDGDNSGWVGNMTVRANTAEMFNTRFNISQMVEGLEPGHYMLYVQAYYRNGNHPDAHEKHANGTEELLAKFSLNDMSKPVVSLMGEVHDGYWWAAPNSMEEANTVFKQNPDHFANYLMAYVEENGTLSIRFSKDEVCDSDWFIMGNLRLFRVPSAHSGIVSIEEAVTRFSPDAVIYDLQGRRLGNYAGLSRLAPGVYVISENGRSAKFRK